MLWGNLRRLRRPDEVKFVLADRADYLYARSVISRYGLVGRCGVLFSPVMSARKARLAPARLARWMLADGLDVRLSLQLHKIIWPGRTRGV
jgi:7-carboxy-7-deazaguanine synthase